MTSPTLQTDLAVDALVRQVRARGYRSYAEVARGLRHEAADYPPTSPIACELRARAGRFERAWARQEARREAKAKENAA